MFALAAGFWLERFQLLYSTQGVLFGAGFTDAHIDLPARTLLGWGGLAIALFLTWRTCFWNNISVPAPVFCSFWGPTWAAS